MVQNASITPQELLAEIMPSTPAFCVTRVIGRKLGALYDDTAQQCPDRVANLLMALRGGSFGSH
jgi:hypothetical protein